jgi:hypothetical protein
LVSHNPTQIRLATQCPERFFAFISENSELGKETRELEKETNKQQDTHQTAKSSKKQKTTIDSNRNNTAKDS